MRQQLGRRLMSCFLVFIFMGICIPAAGAQDTAADHEPRLEILGSLANFSTKTVYGVSVTGLAPGVHVAHVKWGMDGSSLTDEVMTLDGTWMMSVTTPTQAGDLNIHLTVDLSSGEVLTASKSETVEGGPYSENESLIESGPQPPGTPEYQLVYRRDYMAANRPYLWLIVGVIPSHLVIPAGIEAVSYTAFSDCGEVKTLTLPPDQVISEDFALMEYMPNLQSVVYEGTSAEWAEHKGVNPEQYPHILFTFGDAPTQNPEPSPGSTAPDGSGNEAPQVSTTTFSNIFETMTHLTHDAMRDIMSIEEQNKLIITRGDETVGTDGWAATGDEYSIVSAEGETVKHGVIVIMGDVIGNGTMSLSQIIRTAQAFTGIQPLDGVYAKAADFNESGKVDLSDVIAMAQLWRDAA